MDEDDHFAEGAGELGADTRRSGAAILASGLLREAQLLATAANGLWGTLDLFPMDGSGPDAEDRKVARDGAQQAAALAGALLFAARHIMRSPDDMAGAARLTLGRLPRTTLSAGEVLGHLRTAALLTITDDGAARVAAAVLAETFEREFTAAWNQAKAR